MRIAVIGVAVLVAVALGYYLSGRSEPPVPTVGAGQSIRNPFGNASPNAPDRGAGTAR